MRKHLYVNGLDWILNEGVTPDHLGLVPYFFHASDLRKATEQVDENYAHGGGWRDYGLKWKYNPEGMTLTYLDPEGDEVYEPLATTFLRDERIVFYNAAWTAIIQPDGSMTVSRLD